mmetsp:Transcript_106321/g.200180  ORF Transcript_106321/g.200180 Transcript_106321/m.200180 type:complete len:91 (-) Transcript_106321:303-575(-)
MNDMLCLELALISLDVATAALIREVCMRLELATNWVVTPYALTRLEPSIRATCVAACNGLERRAPRAGGRIRSCKTCIEEFPLDNVLEAA